jgi:hypothetical protein
MEGFMRKLLINKLKEVEQSVVLHFDYDSIKQDVLISNNVVLKKCIFQKGYSYIQLDLNKENTSFIIAIYEALNNFIKAEKEIKLLSSNKG